MKLIEFKTNKEIEVNNIDELREILIYCNPLMMRHYEKQMKHVELKKFGISVEIKRKK